MIQILNRTLGFQTNSSSSHALVILNRKEKKKIKDQDENNYYGGNDFVCLSLESKKRYFKAMLARYFNIYIGDYKSDDDYDDNDYDDIELQCASDTLDLKIKEEFGEEIYKELLGTATVLNNFGSDISLDFPKGFNGKIHKEFAILIMKYFFREDVAVMGGYDNDDMSFEQYTHFPLKYLFSCNSVIRQDDYGFWIIFDKEYGERTIFKLGREKLIDNLFAPKTSTPCLVDFKITNFCNRGCRYCYQSSNENGEHAASKNIYSILRALAVLEVFEIAIGGGEPTLHPAFLNILHSAHELGITPNFTTRNIDYLVKNNDEISKYIGQVAISCDTPTEVEHVISLRNHIPNFSIQLVMGMINRYDFKKIVDICNEAYVPLSLLGYKSIGRGFNCKPINYDWWLDDLASAAHVFIDTALASQYKQKILEDTKYKKLYIGFQEGVVSCYIDAVSNFMAKSSYSDSGLSFDKNKNLAQFFKSSFADF